MRYRSLAVATLAWAWWNAALNGDGRPALRDAMQLTLAPASDLGVYRRCGQRKLRSDEEVLESARRAGMRKARSGSLKSPEVWVS